MPALHERIMDLALKRGFILPAAEIYGSASGFYDYGPEGAALKRNIQDLWRQIFIVEPGHFEVETGAVLPAPVLVASGHAASFADPLVECAGCKQRFRADHLLEQKSGQTWAGKAAAQLNEGLKAHAIPCPQCKGALGEVSSFNLMFATSIGTDKGNIAYLRPETAQGIFLAFNRVFRDHGSKLPMGIGQVGRSFRNEISPRQGLVRMREFTQMELEYFFNPKRTELEGYEALQGTVVRIKPPTAGEGAQGVEAMTVAQALERGHFPNPILAGMVARQQRFYEAVGMPKDKFHFRVMPKDELPHYSMGNVDLEVETAYGFIETAGTAYRTDFDLASHSKHSKEDLSVAVQEAPTMGPDGKPVPSPTVRVMPHVVEPSMGVDRLIYALLEHSHRPAGPGKEWEWFAFPPRIAPFVANVFPLMKKDGLDELGLKLVASLRDEGLAAQYSQSGSIGRRYARADEIGVPYCITIDYQTKEDGTVTVRFRDDGAQVRVKMDEVPALVRRWVKEGKTKA